jgi:hypothetical protein
MQIRKKLIYRRSRDYKAVPATGAWGGPTPNGMIAVDFFLERSDLPTEETIILDDQTNTARVEPSKDPDMVREVECGILVRPEAAYAIGRFLIEKAKQAGFQPPPDDR